MKIDVANFEPTTAPDLERRLVEAAVQQVAKDLAGLQHRHTIGQLDVNMGMPIRRVLDGYMTEKAAASTIAEKLLNAILGNLPVEAATEFQQRKSWFGLFGTDVPTEPKTLEQLLAERLDDVDHPLDPKQMEYWLKQAKAQMAKNPHLSQQIQQYNRKILDWIYAQGAKPQQNPVDNVGEPHKSYSKKARKVIADLHKLAKDADDFIHLLQSTASTLHATGDKADGMVAALLQYYITKMGQRGEPEVYAADPSLASVNERYVAARIILAGIPDGLPQLKLPSGVPGLQKPDEGFLDKYRKTSEEAVNLAKGAIAVAMNMGAGDPSGQYHYVHYMALRYARSGKDVENLASLILQRYLRKQKKPWARKQMESILLQQPSRDCGWKLTDDVKMVDRKGELSGDPVPPAQMKRVEEAWERIRQIVSPEVLEKIQKVGVRVHPYWDKWWKLKEFRAHYTPRKQEIHVHTREPTDVIMHEFGHHIEDRGGLRPWLNVQRLLRNRAQSNKLQAMGFFRRDEVRFDSKMSKDAGNYASRYYEYGSTEVMSMGMQLFENPEAATRLFMDDPEMFYTVLAAVRG